MAPETNLSVSDELTPVALQIQKDQKTFDQDFYGQEAQITILREKWKGLPEAEKKILLQQFALLFPRSRAHENPTECLRKILSLPNWEDVQRALRVSTTGYGAYKFDPGEEIYPATGWLGRYLDYARWNKVPLALHFWAGLSILGAAVRRNFFIDNNLEYIWMNQFIILTGAKGSGKSAARRIAKDVLFRMNQRLAAQEEKQKIKSAKAFQVPMLPSDITPQDLVKQLSMWSNCTRHIYVPGGMKADTIPGEAVAILISDELSNLAGKGTYSAQLIIPLLTELCFESTYTKSTVTGGKQEIERMAFSILACTQPGWMRGTIVSETKEGGFVERVNFIHRPPSVARGGLWDWMNIPVLDPLQAENLAEHLLELAMRSGHPQVLRLTDNASRYFSDWYQREYKKGPRDSIDSYKHSLDRRCIHLMRMSALLSISEGTSIPYIKVSHLQQAIPIIEEEDKFLPIFMAEANETEEGIIAREVLAWITRHGGIARKTDLGQWMAQKFSMLKEDRERIYDLLLDTKQMFTHSKKGIWYGLPGVPPP